MHRISTRTKKMIAVYFVGEMPLPAPTRASAAPPPKAMPAPASFLGNCTSTSSVRTRQSVINRTDSKTVKNVIIILYRILDYIGKTAGFQRCAAHERAVHVRLAHQFGGVGRFDAATI